MPTNVSFHYIKAEKEYHEAENSQQKLKALKKMLATVPKHKGTEKLQKDIKDKIRKLKYQQEKEKKQKKGKGRSITVKKEGAAQIVFVGLPNSGKSTLLSKLSGKPVEIAAYQFTTKMPEVRMIPFENIKLQGVEIPALYDGIEETVRGRQMLSIVRNTDFIVVVAKEKKSIQQVKDILEKIGIKLGKEKRREGFIDYMPSIEVTWKDFNKELIKKIWLKQNKIRVQTKAHSQKAAEKPVILKVGDTVEKLAKIVHKDFVRKFRFAKIWGPSAKFAGQQVGLAHKLKDCDIIELFIR